jgi:hypothetical protein
VEAAWRQAWQSGLAPTECASGAGIPACQGARAQAQADKIVCPTECASGGRHSCLPRSQGSGSGRQDCLPTEWASGAGIPACQGARAQAQADKIVCPPNEPVGQAFLPAKEPGLRLRQTRLSAPRNAPVGQAFLPAKEPGSRFCLPNRKKKERAGTRPAPKSLAIIRAATGGSPPPHRVKATPLGAR